MQQSPPLNYESSAGETHLTTSSSLPTEVVQVLQHARYLHLATCTALMPHVSLMNYTYLPSTPYSSHPTIIMTTNPTSKKTHNLVSNPNVSLLVHDWVSHRPRTASTNDRSASPPPSAPSSSLAELLLNLNTSELSSISTTINGVARIVQSGSEEERYLKERHVENNTFESSGWNPNGDGGGGCYIQGEEVQVVVVDIKDGRVSDWKGEVRDWVLDSTTLPNGV